MNASQGIPVPRMPWFHFERLLPREQSARLFYSRLMRWKPTPPLGPFWVVVCLFFMAALTRAPGAAENLVTNLHQFQRLAAVAQRVTAPVQLRGVVCWIAPGGDLIVLQDASGAALLEADPFGPVLHPGDVVAVEGLTTGTEGVDGFRMGKTLVVNNDRIRAWQESSGAVFLNPGSHPFRVGWFGRGGTNALRVQYAGPGLEQQVIPNSALSHLSDAPAAAPRTLAPGVRWRSFLGAWWQMPEFDRLRPHEQGVVGNFDLGVRSRDEYVALCYDGWLEVSKAGVYTFTVASAGGSQLRIGLPQVAVVGHAALPAPQRVGLGQILAPEPAGFWAEAEGRVDYVSRRADGGATLTLRSDTGMLRAEVIAGSGVWPEGMSYSRVRLTGICWSAATLDDQHIPGVLWVPGPEQIQILAEAPRTFADDVGREPDQPPATASITTIKHLKREAAMQGYPVKIRGVVTWAERTAVVVQDSTAGIFVDEVEVNDSCHDRLGEHWEVEGITVAQFSPMIRARRVQRLGRGVLPEPARPTWDQLMNGSLDTHYVELRGVATAVESNRVTLLTGGGKVQAHLPDTSVEDLRSHEGALIRIRGCLWAVKDEVTHVFKIGEVQIRAARINVEEAAPAYPFATPLKRAAELLLFDAQAALLKPVKVAGQVVHIRGDEHYLMDGTNGLRFIPRAAVRLNVGDQVEVVGFPELGGPSPVLREALVRQTAHGEPPAPLRLAEDFRLPADLDARRVRLEALLLNLSKDPHDQVLGLQAGPHVFVARLPAREAAPVSFPVGSRLELTGVFAGRVENRAEGRQVDSFELLLHSPADVRLLARPAWHTLRRMMVVVGVLVGGLLLASVWITLLRRQVEQRTVQLRAEIQERERAEQLRAVEAERSRIARDLHDDLGSSLTEISLLADAGLGHPPSPERALGRFRTIAAKARALVQALDVIVWLVNPSKDALPFLVGYLGSYAEEFLGASGLGCRLKIPMDMPAPRLNADVRHNLFLAVKEVLHNVVRHAHASEARVTFALCDGMLEIAIADNGQGFDPSTPVEGNGLANLRQRLAGIGGRCEIEAQPGAGVTVRLTLPLPSSPQTV